MFKSLRHKLLEALQSVAPIIAIVLVLCFSITPLPVDIMLMFIVGAVLLVFGAALFSGGVDMAMTPMGEAIGSDMTKTRRVGLVLFICFLIGAIITIAEPDLQVLAEQVPTIPNLVLILTIALGVGLFLVVAVLRILFHIPLRWMLLGFYLLTFLVAFLAPRDFIPLAFDSGGVTTGPITVPFILALGVGISTIRGDRGSQDDSFGLVALCSIGPILMVLLLGMFYRPTSADYQASGILSAANTREVGAAFVHAFPEYLLEVAWSILPIIGVFVLFNILTRRFRNARLVRMTAGFFYAYIGLVLFLTGANTGFMPVGSYLGKALAASRFSFLLIPLAMAIGYFVVVAEPSVQVLNKQVEEITNGAVTQKAMSLSLSIGVAISAGLAMTRVVTGINIFWFLIPGYAIAIGLSFFVPKLFTGIAFDSGGVASGMMTATFLLPFTMGACEALGGNLLTDAFGVVAMVAMTPLLTIQVLGLYSRFKSDRLTAARATVDALEDDIIDYEAQVLSSHSKEVSARG
ncbi:MAG: DUF1538 domain-containing protein [Ruminococcaceae bacterium]|nr:DUF1538 domain-containing protein [Oscillospiraceae bacterium]